MAFCHYLRLFGQGPPSALSERRKRGEGPLCWESEYVGGGDLGEGRVKGPLPDGPLTLWCPVAPSQPSLGSGILSWFPSSPTLEPREARRNFSDSVPWQWGKGGLDFKTRVPGVETEALAFGLRDPSGQDLG